MHGGSMTFHSFSSNGNILHNSIIISKPLVDSCNHHQNPDTELLYHPRLLHVLCSYTYPSFLPPYPRQPLVISIILLFQGCYIDGILQYVTLQVWLFFTQNNALNIHPVVACISNLSPPFFLLSFIPQYGIYHSLTIHSLKNI